MYSLFAFGSSSNTSKTYFGFSEGNIDTKVFTFFSEYLPSMVFCAVPVLPATLYPCMLAKLAVPSFVDTIFRKTLLTLFDIFLFKIFFFFFLSDPYFLLV